MLFFCPGNVDAREVGVSFETHQQTDNLCRHALLQRHAGAVPTALDVSESACRVLGFIIINEQTVQTLVSFIHAVGLLKPAMFFLLHLRV